MTAGYGRSSRDYYEEHDQPKQLYLRELRRRALRILRQGRLPSDLAGHEEKVSGPCPLRATHLGSHLEVFVCAAAPHRWQTAAIALGGQSPSAPDRGAGAHRAKEQRDSCAPTGDPKPMNRD